MEGPLLVVIDCSGSTSPGLFAQLALDAGLPVGDPAGALAAAGNAILSADEEDDWGRGASAVAVRFDERGAAIAHAGDCRAWLWRGRELRAVTRDHTLVEQLLAEGLLTPEQAKTYPHRNVLTRGLGIRPDPEIEVGRIELEAGDRMLLTTDGVHEAVTDMAALVATADPERAIAEILAEARQLGGDNATAALVVID
jgi:serine/threonine protein phosphatase PrpC